MQAFGFPWDARSIPIFFVRVKESEMLKESLGRWGVYGEDLGRAKERAAVQLQLLREMNIS